MSPDYGSKIGQFILSNTQIYKSFPSNLKTTILIKCETDGSVKSWSFDTLSSNPEWDEVVKKSVLRITQERLKIPKDIDGRLPPLGFLISVSPPPN